MRAIRNFIYNFSDIFVALIIIALAAFLIWTRVDIIMDYPAAKADADSTKVSTDAEPLNSLDYTDNSTQPDSSTDYREVVIPEGSSTDVVAGLLKQAGLVVNVDDFTYQVGAMGYDGMIQPGVHEIPLGLSMEELIILLCQNEADLQSTSNTDNSTPQQTNNSTNDINNRVSEISAE